MATRGKAWLFRRVSGVLMALVLVAGMSQAETVADEGSLIREGFDTSRALELVERLSQRWRLRGGGNPGFDAAVDDVVEYLESGGFSRAGKLTVVEGPLTLQPRAWDIEAASLELLQPHQELLHSFEETPTLVAKYSRPTPEEGVIGDLVDVGGGEHEEDYEGLTVEGRIVLGRGHIAELFEQAVVRRGALGVVSDRLRKEEFRQRYPSMVLAGKLPFPDGDTGEVPNGWGLKISPSTADRLRDLLREGKARVRVRLSASFFESSQRGVVAKIRGATHPQEKIVLVSHLDNNAPGANNNASGVATHAELARLLATAIAEGRLEPPSRSLVFLIGVEHELSKRWLDELDGDANEAVAMINADMTGADTDKTGGIYRLERLPDPTMSHAREPEFQTQLDERSGWGFRPLDIDPYPGHYLGSLIWLVAQQTAAESGRPILSSPFEGGSDHDDFLSRRVPAVLSWYWEDPFLSTNLDTPDKVSPESMRFVAQVNGLAALQLASASTAASAELVGVLRDEAARRLRLELEAGRGGLLKAASADSAGGLAAALADERMRMELWGDWYQQAIEALIELPVDPVSEKQRMELLAAGAEAKAAYAVGMEQLEALVGDLNPTSEEP